MPSVTRARARAPDSPTRGAGRAKEIFADIQHDFALSCRVVFYVMAGVMLVSFIVALVGMPAGKVEEAAEEDGLQAAPAG